MPHLAHAAPPGRRHAAGADDAVTAAPPALRLVHDSTHGANAPAAKTPELPDAAASSVQPRLPANGVRDLLLYALIGALVLGAWWISQLGLFDRKSDIAYWLGVSGGVGMLLLLTYPMRKHLRFMRSAGPAGHWFFLHMVLGIGGPLLILLHSGFRIGSLNAGVAFYSMIVVACSGIIGRFLYLRVHRSLSGERLTLARLREERVQETEVVTQLRFGACLTDHCRRFERFAIERRMVTGPEVIRAMVVVPWVRWSTARACRAELRRRLVTVAHARGWSRRRLQSRLDQADALTRNYLAGAQRVAMFAAWERLFSWWHIAHMPFVYILAISAIVHVVAVHAY